VPEVSELPCGRLVPPWSVSPFTGYEDIQLLVACGEQEAKHEDFAGDFRLFIGDGAVDMWMELWTTGVDAGQRRQTRHT
jgi:hypothetical protein